MLAHVGVLLLAVHLVACRENPITRNLELTLPDKRGSGNQICWNNARFFEYTGTNAFSRIQKEGIHQDTFRAKTRRFPTYQDLADGDLTWFIFSLTSDKDASIGGLMLVEDMK